MKSPVRAVLVGIFAASTGSAVACGSTDAPPAETFTEDAAPPPQNDVKDAGPSNPEPDAGPVSPIDAPIEAPPSTWTWVDFPDAVCDDGTPTGIGIWPSPSSKKLMFFFAGGGACWDFDSCITNPKSVHGPFGKTEFDKSSPAFGGWIIGHGADNPFKDWTTVFVPYCTGDLHAGDLVKTYTDGTTSKDVHHKGRANVAAYLKRLLDTYPSLDELAVTGSSAGGGGALFSYPAIRTSWPNAKSFLVDDSLPFFKDALPLPLRQAWFDSWNLTPLTTPICGANCVDDMSQLFGGVASQYPNDRMALLSFTTDYVIAGYYGIGAFDYWKVLGKFTPAALDPSGHFKHFYVDTWGHTMLTDVGKHTVKGNKLIDWLAKMESGDPTWDSVP